MIKAVSSSLRGRNPQVAIRGFTERDLWTEFRVGSSQRIICSKTPHLPQAEYTLGWQPDLLGLKPFFSANLKQTNWQPPPPPTTKSRKHLSSMTNKMYLDIICLILCRQVPMLAWYHISFAGHVLISAVIGFITGEEIKQTSFYLFDSQRKHAMGSWCRFWKGLLFFYPSANLSEG